MDEASEEIAVQLAAQGVIGKRVDEMESGFMMALDYMIQLAQNDQDDKVSCFYFLYLHKVLTSPLLLHPFCISLTELYNYVRSRHIYFMVPAQGTVGGH